MIIINNLKKLLLILFLCVPILSLAVVDAYGGNDKNPDVISITVEVRHMFTNVLDSRHIVDIPLNAQIRALRELEQDEATHLRIVQFMFNDDFMWPLHTFRLLGVRSGDNIVALGLPREPLPPAPPPPPPIIYA